MIPHSEDAERSVAGAVLDRPAIVGELTNTGLLPGHFYLPAYRLLYGAVVEAHYADEPTDPVSLSARLAAPLGAAWGTTETQTVQRLQELAETRPPGKPVDHAGVIQERANARLLVGLATEVLDEVASGQRDAAEIAGIASTGALRIATGYSDTQGELISMADSGRAFIIQLRTERAAREQGIELGCYFDIPAMDGSIHGLRPTELLIAAGEPGVGKSAVFWRAGMNFAQRQLRRPEGERVGALVISLEMGQHPSNVRLGQAFSGVSGTALREGDVDEAQLKRVIEGWAAKKDLPLWFNYAPKLRTSQIRALVGEAIRRHNVGLVVIDHFRMFDLDKRLPNKNDEDEDKVRFLKEDLAGELNVAVICLAHTRKKDGMSGDARPRLSDLRGSGQIAAHSDFTCFIHRPYKYASEDEKASGEVQRTDAELIWEKNRHGHDGKATFYFDPETMTVL